MGYVPSASGSYKLANQEHTLAASEWENENEEKAVAQIMAEREQADTERKEAVNSSWPWCEGEDDTNMNSPWHALANWKPEDFADLEPPKTSRKYN